MSLMQILATVALCLGIAALCLRVGAWVFMEYGKHWEKE